MAAITPNGFSMVANHWSNDGMVTIHRYGLLDNLPNLQQTFDISFKPRLSQYLSFLIFSIPWQFGQWTYKRKEKQCLCDFLEIYFWQNSTSQNISESMHIARYKNNNTNCRSLIWSPLCSLLIWFLFSGLVILGYKCFIVCCAISTLLVIFLFGFLLSFLS